MSLSLWLCRASKSSQVLFGFPDHFPPCCLSLPLKHVCLLCTASGVSGPLLVGLLHSRACFSCDWQIRTWLCPCCIVPPQAVFLPWNPLSLSLISPQVFIDFQKRSGGREIEQVDLSMQAQTWLMSWPGRSVHASTDMADVMSVFSFDEVCAFLCACLYDTKDGNQEHLHVRQVFHLPLSYTPSPQFVIFWIRYLLSLLWPFILKFFPIWQKSFFLKEAQILQNSSLQPMLILSES